MKNVLFGGHSDDNVLAAGVLIYGDWNNFIVSSVVFPELITSPQSFRRKSEVGLRNLVSLCLTF